MLSNLFSNIIYFDEITSTNDYLKENYLHLNNYSVIMANYQTKGRGQFDRVWQANKGENLLFSILIKENFHFIQNKINPIIITALISLLKEYNVDAYFKYPNDIYVNDKKICGILIETKYDQDNLIYVIIGIGLNINQIDFNNLNGISLNQVKNENVNITEVFYKLLMYIENNIELVNMIKKDDELNDNKAND